MERCLCPRVAGRIGTCWALHWKLAPLRLPQLQSPTPATADRHRDRRPSIQSAPTGNLQPQDAHPSSTLSWALPQMSEQLGRENAETHGPDGGGGPRRRRARLQCPYPQPPGSHSMSGPHPHPQHLPLTSSITQPALLISSYSAGSLPPTYVPTEPEQSPPKAILTAHPSSCQGPEGVSLGPTVGGSASAWERRGR